METKQPQPKRLCNQKSNKNPLKNENSKKNLLKGIRTANFKFQIRQENKKGNPDYVDDIWISFYVKEEIVDDTSSLKKIIKK